tara:strand:- start:19336 stop:20850 length:1515 start_codon:yes stop_codon:yes gene_type:complete
MIAKLNREQERACLLEPDPIAVVLAGAGAGKTRLLAAKIVEDQESVGRERQIIVTFTNAAADELRDRVVEYGGSLEVRHLGTLHSWALRELRGANLQGISQLEIIGDKRFDRIVKEEAKRMGWKGSLRDARELACLPRRVAGIARVVGAAIMTRCCRDGVLHPDMILGLAAGRVDDFALPPGCRIYVDEFQDSGPVDEKIYRAAIEHHGATLFLVGDVRQSVYGFRGASPAILARIWEQTPPDCRAELVSNYRSKTEIVGLGNRIARRMLLPEGSAADMNPVDNSISVREIIHRTEFVTQEAEAEAVADWLLHTLKAALADGLPTRWGDVAILCRYNQQVEMIAGVLQAHRIPVQCSAWDERDSRELISDDEIVSLANQATRDGVDWARACTDAGIGFEAQERLLPSLMTARCPEDVVSILRGELLPSREKVYVGTIHSAKGLEWSTVWIAGADEEALPEDEESKRLAYVAATRAKRHLIISAASSRQGFRRLLNLNVTKTIPK